MKIYQRLTNKEFIEKLEFNRFAIMALGMTFQSCLASVAVYEILKNLTQEQNLVPLCIIAPICMGANAMALAQAPIKVIIGSFLISTITSLSLLMYVYIAF